MTHHNNVRLGDSGKSPQLPAFCRTRRPITTTVRVSTLQQLLWLLLLVVFLQLTTILLVLADHGPGPAPLRQLAVPQSDSMASAPLAGPSRSQNDLYLTPGSISHGAIASLHNATVHSTSQP